MRFLRFALVRSILRSLLLFVVSCALAASAHAQEGVRASARPTLSIYHAGSLSAVLKAVEKVYTQRTGVCVTDVPGGSVAGARTVTAGRVPCDIYASADYEIIDRMMKPAGVADYTIRFGEGAMVLAYRTTSKHAETIARGRLDPPASIPDVAPDWYEQMIGPGVSSLGSNPFLDPGGYRADLIFQLAQAKYGVPNLYSTMLVAPHRGRVCGSLALWARTSTSSSPTSTARSPRSAERRHRHLPLRAPARRRGPRLIREPCRAVREDRHHDPGVADPVVGRDRAHSRHARHPGASR